MPTFVDTHAHIHDDFAEVDAAIARAAAAGVGVIVTLGVNRGDSERAVVLAERYARPGAAVALHAEHSQPGAAVPRVFAAVGVHPHDAKDASGADLDALEAMAADVRVVMVGEIGLDYYRDLSPRDVQRRVLMRQLETAGRVGKPVAVHARDAHDDMLPLLEAWSRDMGGRLADGRPIGVMHYFSGDVDLAQRYIELGFFVSIHTSVTHPKATMLQAVARDAPLGALVIETDSPYGAPQRYRGKRNEPAYVVEAAVAIAALRGIGIDEVAGATTANALRLLGIASPPGPLSDERSGGV
jgi:TatD DNase family protein